MEARLSSISVYQNKWALVAPEKDSRGVAGLVSIGLGGCFAFGVVDIDKRIGTLAHPGKVTHYKKSNNHIAHNMRLAGAQKVNIPTADLYSPMVISNRLRQEREEMLKDLVRSPKEESIEVQLGRHQDIGNIGKENGILLDPSVGMKILPIKELHIPLGEKTQAWSAILSTVGSILSYGILGRQMILECAYLLDLPPVVETNLRT